MLISLIVPIFNEIDNLPSFHHRAGQVLNKLTTEYEIIYINDGSKDASLFWILSMAEKDKHLKYIDLSRNFGHQVAVMSGIDHAKGDYICIIDADLQDPPELIEDLYHKAISGFDVVYAKRRTRVGDSSFKIYTAKWFYRILAKLSNVDIPLDSGDFRIFNKKIAAVLKKMPEYNKYLRGQVAWIGMNQTYVEFDRQQRNAGSTGYNLRKMLRLAIDGITAFSSTPLKIVSYLGIVISLFAVILVFYVLFSIYVRKSFVPGWGSIMVTMLFLGGVQMIAIGIIGEYLSRINQNILGRPLYVIKETNIKD